MTAIVLTLALLLQPPLQQPAPTPVQRPAEITISVEEYAKLKTCEAQIEELKTRGKSKNKSIVVAIIAGTIIAIAAIAKKKQ